MTDSLVDGGLKDAYRSGIWSTCCVFTVFESSRLCCNTMNLATQSAIADPSYCRLLLGYFPQFSLHCLWLNYRKNEPSLVNFSSEKC